MTHNAFGGTGRVQDEEYQQYLISQTTPSLDDNTTAYCNHEHNAFQSFPRASFTSFVAHDHTHSGIFGHNGAPPMLSQQFPRFTQPDYPHSLMLSQYFSEDRPSMQSFQPVHGMTQPQVMISRGVNYTMSQSVPYSMGYQLPASAYSPDLVSPTTSSPSLSFMSSPEQYYLHPTWHRSILIPSLEENTSNRMDDLEEKEGPFDKPYAQLIYDALMQAPGHRMLLRDIYEWFIHNSRKPRESGTNGWQNSIRHNLSMNQAFENDKNDPVANRGSRKANSVWVLTEEAIQNGVQSTTRFRKNNKNHKNSSSKKSAGNKAPAIQRQRSGARGGRAAKRAAQLKRTGGTLAKAESSEAEFHASHPFSFSEHGTATYQDDWYRHGAASPSTPEADHFLTPSYNLPEYSQFEVGDASEIKYEADPFLDEEDRLRIILSQVDSDDVTRDLARY